MHEAEADRAACAMAMDHLLSFSWAGVTPEVLRHYLDPRIPAPARLSEVYRRLIESAENRGMGPTVIGGAIGGVARLGPLLSEFDPHAVHRTYGDDSTKLMDDIVRKLKPRGKVLRNPGSLWPLFCRSVVTGAAFLSQFRDAGEFSEWVLDFDRDERKRVALPMLLSVELEGFGFALACDFLKELGYLNFAKPDVHLKAILKGTGLARERASDYEVFKAVVRIAGHQGVSAYHVDKLFWLVGSGYFYDHKATVGNEGRVDTDRGQFIKLAAAALR